MSNVLQNNSCVSVDEFVEFVDARGETYESLDRKYGLEPVKDVVLVFFGGKRHFLKAADVKRILKQWKRAEGTYA